MLYNVIHVVPLMCLCVCSLKQSVSAVVKTVESGSPNVPVCMQIIFALNTKSERQVVPVHVSLSLQQKRHPLSRDSFPSV